LRKVEFEIVEHYRRRTFRIDRSLAIHSIKEAVDFVNCRGFVFFWPIKNIVLPSLWVSVAGDRPVPNEHDDPGHITWRWKDAAIGKRYWYYTKMLRKKSTMISFDLVPFFYALSNNFGVPESDFLTLYEQGKLSHEEKVIYEVLLNEGKKDTIELGRLSHFKGRSNENRFNRAIINLQADFKILPVGIARVGSWKYAYEYDLVMNAYPEIIEQAQLINKAKARLRIGEYYMASIGASQVNDWIRLFHWTKEEVVFVIERLAERGVVEKDVEFVDKPGTWIALKKIL